MADELAEQIDYTVNSLMDWEDGKLDFEQEVKLFQQLVDSGAAWQLQGMYGRRAKWLIDQGYVHLTYRRVDA